MALGDPVKTGGMRMNELVMSQSDERPPESFYGLLTDRRFAALVHRLTELKTVAVALSGGADSAFLAYVARIALGRESVHAITAVSPSLGSGELEHCRSLAELWDIPFSSVETREMENLGYVANGEDRCYWCKSELMSSVSPMIGTVKSTVVLGVNMDDLSEHRPGQKAARDAGAVFPLVDSGYTKALIREHSRALGLPTWDRPQSACLASRIPYGTRVSVALLGKVDRAEVALKRLGFRQVRVRHYDAMARLEFLVEDFQAVLQQRREIVAAVKSAGYRYVTVDLEGFRSGNLNQNR